MQQKCTDNPRDQFRDEVLPAFGAWVSGARDNQLVQSTMSLLDRFELSDDEHVQIYNRLVQERPLAFQASLTVSPGSYDGERCAALFRDFRTITPEAQDRFGDIFP